MKNKKLISLVCVLSMIISMFAGFTVVKADGETTETPGIVLETQQTTSTEAKVIAKYTGFPNGIITAKVIITVPEGITVESATTPYDDEPTINDTVEGQYLISFAGKSNKTSTDNVVAEFNLKLNDLAKNQTVALTGDTYIGDLVDGAANKYSLTSDDPEKKLAAATTVVKADPNAPEPVAPIDKPSVTDAEKPVEKTEVTKGVKLVAEDGKDDDGNYTVNAYYVGFENGIITSKLTISVPTDSVVTGTTPYDDEPTINNTVDGQYLISFAGKSNKTSTDNLVATFKIKTATTKNFDVKLISDTYIGDLVDGAANKYSIDSTDPEKKLVADYATVKVVADPKNEVALADKFDPEDVSDVEDTADDAYLAIEVTKDDNTNPEYGKDYVAYYNDIELSKQQLDNILAGAYASDAEDPITLADAANGITFKYNDGVNIRMQLVADGVVVAEETTDNSDDPTPVTYKKPTLSVKASKTSTTVGSGDTITVTATYDFKDYADNATVAISAVDDTLDLATSSGFKIEYEQAEADLLDLVTKIEDEVTLIDNIAAKGTIKITYKPGSVGTAKFTFAITGQNEAGTVLDPAVTGSASTKINKVSTSGSSSSSSDKDNTSSGGGAIASGLVDSGSSYLPSLGFDDLGDVTWAQTAINTLAAKKIVSGVGDNKFDPNAALTRAAYAQMLVNAIGHSTDSADTYFDDVPTDAWFYHNVAVASQLGIVSGFGDGTFRPNDLITREQMALMTQKAAVVMGKSLVGADVGTFTDDADIADWSRDAVYTLANAGIINGMGDGTFAPQANATRAQAAVIIYNAFVK